MCPKAFNISVKQEHSYDSYEALKCQGTAPAREAFLSGYDATDESG